MKLLLCFVTVMTLINSSSLLSVPLKAETVAEPYGREYWYNSAHESIIRRLQYIKERKPRAKNIVMVIGDGMSIATATAARILRGQRLGRSGEEGELAWDTFPAVALAKTYNLDAQTGESSACATALMCGVKANYETLGLDAGGRFNNCISSFTARVSSLVDWAQEAGKSTGIVTTTRITHATPAALFAHSSSRYWEDDGKVPPAARVSCKDIALQMVENEPGRNIHVLLGGGRRHFLPKVAKDPEHPTEEGRRLDGRNLIDDWLRDKKRRGLKAQYVWNKSQLNAVSGDVDHLLGLFEYSHLSFVADRPLGDEADPSLAEMTRAALNVLQKNSKGFFLLIEGGRIDHAHHYNNPYRALDETLELETALLAALERVNPAETLLLVTSDHSHVMTMGGNAAPRGNPILGADARPSDMDGLPYSTLLYGNGPGHSDPRAANNASDMNAVHAAAAPRAWATHGGEDVPVYSLGPLATILFTGTVEQSYIPHAIAYVACIGHYAKRCSEVENFTLPQVTTCIAPEVSSVSAAGTGSGSRPAHTSGQMVVASSVMADDVIRASTSGHSRLLPSASCLLLTLLFRYNFLVRVSIYCLNRSSLFKHFCFMCFIVK